MPHVPTFPKNRKNRGFLRFPDTGILTTVAILKPGLHIVVTIAEHASDVAPKRILRLSIHRLQIFLVKCGYL